MFGNLFKSISAEYLFAGYCVRKSLSVVNKTENGKMCYEIFEYSYLDNYLSLFYLMEDGSYKYVDGKINVPSIDTDELISKHLYTGTTYNINDYETYDKNQVIGVFGLRKIADLPSIIDKRENEKNENAIKTQALIDKKRSYSGMEVDTIIKKFNQTVDAKTTFEVPAITNGPEDTFKSIIGDKLDYYDFISEKDDDQIVEGLKKIADSMDGIGNLKKTS